MERPKCPTGPVRSCGNEALESQGTYSFLSGNLDDSRPSLSIHQILKLMGFIYLSYHRKEFLIYFLTSLFGCHSIFSLLHCSSWQTSIHLFIPDESERCHHLNLRGELYIRTVDCFTLLMTSCFWSCSIMATMHLLWVLLGQSLSIK